MTREHRLTQSFIKLAETLVDDFDLASVANCVLDGTLQTSVLLTR